MTGFNRYIHHFQDKDAKISNPRLRATKANISRCNGILDIIKFPFKV
jgi:hypothetical protein